MPRTLPMPKSEMIRRYNAGETVEGIARVCGRNYATIHEHLKKAGVEFRRRGPARERTLREDFFQKIDNETTAYWLGFVFADGSIVGGKAGGLNLQVALQRRDEPHLQKMRADLGSDAKIGRYNSKCSFTGKKHPASYVSFSSARLCRDLMKLGCIRRKSYGHPVPTIQDDLKPHFFRGLVDGDGSWIYSNRTARFEVVGTPEMMTFCQDYLIQTLGLSRTKLMRRGRISYVRYTGNQQVGRIARLLYSGSTIALDRKKRRADRFAEICS